jgi:ABC-type transport system substrate-binding protein
MTNEQILAYANPNPIGSGPYVLREREQDSHVIYDANPDYWGGEPKIDVITLKHFADDEGELLALKAGDIDFSSHFGMPSAIPSLTADKNIEIFPITANTTITLYPNQRHEPWNLKAFRLAVSMAINRQDIVNFSANGWGAMPTMVERDAVFSDVQAVIDDVKWPGQDLTQTERIAAANDMLDAIDGISDKPATLPDPWVRTYNGTPLAFNLEAATSFANQLSAANQVLSDLADIGIDLTIVPETSTTLVGRVYRQKSDATMADWELHVWGRAFTSDFDYLANQYQKYASDDSSRLAARSYIIGWTGTAFDTLNTKLVQIQALPEGDATRNTLIGEALGIMAEEAASIPLYSSIAPAVYRNDRYTGWVEGNGYLFYGAIQELADVRNIMNLEPKPVE